MDLNKVMLIGRLTRDPESRTLPQGAAVCSFSIATNLVWNDAKGAKQEKVEYHNIVAWRKLAEICGQYLKKGTRVYIEGRLQTRSWNDPSGATKYRTEIVADNMIMLDRMGASAGPMPSGSKSSAPAEGKGDDFTPPPPAGEDEIKIENIPF